MTSLKIIPLAGPVKARIDVPGSKSYTIRALLLAAMTRERVRITAPLACDDTDAMIACLEILGIGIKRGRSSIEVEGFAGDITDKDYELDAGLSGITLRFLLALCCAIPGSQILQGHEPLNRRPIKDMVESLRGLGARIDYLGKTGYPPVLISSAGLSGKRSSGNKARLESSVSSQYLSALLMAAPLLGGLDIKVSGELASKPYVDMTCGIMDDFGVKVHREGYRGFTVDAGQAYQARRYRVEGDYSGAAYFFAVAALTRSTITVGNLNPDSLQADRSFLKILERMGAKVSYDGDTVTVAGKGVKALDVDMRDCPDQAQTLAVLAAFADGTTRIRGIGSLRVKETERIQALEQELANMGIKTKSTADSLTISGGEPEPATIDTYGDHRMAMSFAVAGARLEGMRILRPEVVNKTFPDFWKRLSEIGVRAKPINRNIVLIGMRGTGKTTVARELSRKLGIKHIDLDELMARKLSMSTPEIVAKHGWGYFRDQEATIAEEISGKDGLLISTGGGIVLRPHNIEALRQNGVIVLLKASLDVMVERLEGSRDRPALTGKKTLRAEIQQVRRERQHLYETAADLVLDTDDLKPKQAADRIIDMLKEDIS